MKRPKRRTKTSQAASRLFHRLTLFGLGLLAILVVFGLGTVSLRHQVAETANSIKRLERSVAHETRRSAELNVELSRATSPQALKRLNRYMRLGLSEPAYTQIVRVHENVEARLYDKTARSMATALVNPQ